MMQQPCAANLAVIMLGMADNVPPPNALLAEGDCLMHYILMCRSLTSAQKAARLLQDAGIFASVTKAPQFANPSGCTYGVKVAERHVTRALEIVRRSGTIIKKVFQTDGKTLSEVQL